MGTMRLVVDAPDGGPRPRWTSSGWASCWVIPGTVSGSTSAIPDPPRSPSYTACSASTSWRSRR